MSKMIEVYDYKYSKGKLTGYVDGRKYLNKKEKLLGYLEGLKFKDKSGETLLILKDNGKITYGDGEKHGILKPGEILEYHTEELIYSYDKEQGKILNSEGSLMLELKGDFSNLNDSDYFGIAGQYLELFA